MSSEHRLVSFDLGNGFAKVRSSTEKGLSYPSVWSVVSETLEGFDMAISPNHDRVIGFEGKMYAIGETVQYKGLTPVTMTHRSRTTTEFYRVLFASALAATVRSSAVCHVVLSLPPAAYWDKDKMKQLLARTYEVDVYVGGKLRRLTYEVPIEFMRVIPEGVGTVCCMALDERGGEQDSALASMQVGIVDVGTYTTDAVLLKGLRIVRSGTDSLPHGLKDIHGKLRTFASKKGVDLDFYRADETIQNGYFTAHGQRIAFDSELVEWSRELVQSISGLIRSKWNGGDDAEQIIITGGGAGLTEMLLCQEFPQARLVENVDSWLANCEGAYRYGLLKEKSGRL